MIEDEMSEEAFGLACDRREPWATAKAWLGAVACDEHLAEYLSTDDLWERAGGDVAGLLAVLPATDVLDVLRVLIAEPLFLDVEVVRFEAGAYVVSVFLRLDGDRGDWRVAAVTTEIVTNDEGDE